MGLGCALASKTSAILGEHGAHGLREEGKAEGETVTRSYDGVGPRARAPLDDFLSIVLEYVSLFL